MIKTRLCKRYKVCLLILSVLLGIVLLLHFNWTRTRNGWGRQTNNKLEILRTRTQSDIINTQTVDQSKLLSTVNQTKTQAPKVATNVTGSMKTTFDKSYTAVIAEQHASLLNKHQVTKYVAKWCISTVDTSTIQTPFKFYIYNLPDKFNTDIVNYFSSEFSYCFDLDFCGMGRELYQYHAKKGRSFTDQNTPNKIISVRDTHMFSLEVIIHKKLIFSKYRTLDPDKADIFYIPAYIGLQCLSQRSQTNMTENVNELVDFLKSSPYFNKGKPHFSTLGKIQREEMENSCPLLQHPETRDITFITVEQEIQAHILQYFKVQAQSFIVAPYPSYIHFLHNSDSNQIHQYLINKVSSTNDQIRNQNLPTPSFDKRNVHLFLAAGLNQKNSLRGKIMSEFKVQTTDSYEAFFNNTTNENIYQVMLVTNECDPIHRNTTVTWMQHSQFCLQPPGDSQTRKSFYDSVLSGCIPVIFADRSKIVFPFQHKLQYSDFTVVIPPQIILDKSANVQDLLTNIPHNKVQSMYENLVKVAQWFQYSIPNGKPQEDMDALTMIFNQLQELHNL